MPYKDLQNGCYSQVNQIYFITTVLSQRKPLFQDFYCAKKVVYEMKRLHEEDIVDSLVWVIMPDHIHWLLSLNDIFTLSKTMQHFKARTAHSVNTFLHQSGTVWQKAYYDHALRKYEDVQGLARYIVANPLRSNLVQNIGDYSLWDAAWL